MGSFASALQSKNKVWLHHLRQSHPSFLAKLAQKISGQLSAFDYFTDISRTTALILIVSDKLNHVDRASWLHLPQNPDHIWVSLVPDGCYSVRTRWTKRTGSELINRQALENSFLETLSKMISGNWHMESSNWCTPISPYRCRAFSKRCLNRLMRLSSNRFTFVYVQNCIFGTLVQKRRQLVPPSLHLLLVGRR